MDSLRTPFKCGEIVVGPSFKRGEFDSHATDCPFVFRHDGQFLMTFVGWDGIGYRTGLATSPDLLSSLERGPDNNFAAVEVRRKRCAERGARCAERGSRCAGMTKTYSDGHLL